MPWSEYCRNAPVLRVNMQMIDFHFSLSLFSSSSRLIFQHCSRLKQEVRGGCDISSSGKGSRGANVDRNAPKLSLMFNWIKSNPCNVERVVRCRLVIQDSTHSDRLVPYSP